LCTRTRPGTRPAFFHLFLVPELVLISSCPPLRGGSRRERRVRCSRHSELVPGRDRRERRVRFFEPKSPRFSALIFNQNRRPPRRHFDRLAGNKTTRPGDHRRTWRGGRLSRVERTVRRSRVNQGSAAASRGVPRANALAGRLGRSGQTPRDRSQSRLAAPQSETCNNPISNRRNRRPGDREFRHPFRGHAGLPQSRRNPAPTVPQICAKSKSGRNLAEISPPDRVECRPENRPKRTCANVSAPPRQHFPILGKMMPPTLRRRKIRPSITSPGAFAQTSRDVKLTPNFT